MLTVGLDLRSADPTFKAHFGRGIGRYAHELFTELGRIPEEEYGCIVEALSPESLRGGSKEQNVLRRAPFGRVTLETQFVLPRALRQHGIDLAHFVAHGDAPAWSTVPFVVTVHDLIPLRFPDLYRADRPNWRYKLARYLEHQAIRRATGILVISEATKRDVQEFFDIPDERIAVTPLGVRPAFRPLSNREAVRQSEIRHLRFQLGLPSDRPVLLYVGGIDPRKNVEFLLETFAELLKSYAGSSEAKPLLVLAGNYQSDKNYPRILDAISRLKIVSDVQLLGFLEDAALANAYKCADLFLFPSLYEGFGLPLVEAFACGLPTIAGNNSSLPEVCGNSGAALLLPDNERELWVRSIRDLLGSPQRRWAMSAAGNLRAKEFTWERTARLTLAAYRALGGALERQPTSETSISPQNGSSSPTSGAHLRETGESAGEAKIS